MTTHFQAPLDKPSDVILRSKDGVNYRVHKRILADRSPVFKDMLELGDVAAHHDSAELAIVQLSGDIETAAVLDLFLPLLYGKEHSEAFRGVATDRIVDMMLLVVKFDTPSLDFLGLVLQARTLESTLADRAFDIAMTHDLPDLAHYLIPTVASNLIHPKRTSRVAAISPIVRHLVETVQTQVMSEQRQHALKLVSEQLSDHRRSQLRKCYGPKGKKCGGLRLPYYLVLFGDSQESALAALDKTAQHGYCKFCEERSCDIQLGEDRLAELKGLVKAYHALQDGL